MNMEANLIRMTDQEFNVLTGYVKNTYGIDLTKKRILIEGRLTHELNKRGLTAFQQYLDIVFNDKSGTEITLLLNKLTTNLSYFHREKEHYEYLKNQLLPYFEQSRSNKRDLRIWSAGCSTGQEPYDIAMIIDEYFGAKKSMWDTTILATDISMNVLSKADQGIYAAEDLKDVSAEWKAKYFDKIDNNQYKIKEKIRKEVVFRSLNLMEPFQFKKPFDLIFCRNVMIYFNAETKEKLIRKFYNTTADGGFLFIGHSESVNSQCSDYTYIQPAIYQRRG